MRRIAIIFLALHFFTGNMLAEELLKIPNLLRHYCLHRERNPDSTILNFLNLHYVNAQHRQSDPAHRQLPLQHISCNSATCTIPPAPAGVVPPDWPEARRSVLCTADETLLPSDFRARLLRPPRCLFGPVDPGYILAG